MALKLGLPLSHIVPNGVDPESSRLATHGDEKIRLIFLGKFFDSRTDFGLIVKLANLAWVDEVIIGAPGKDKSMLRCIQELEPVLRERLIVVDWLSAQDIAQISGPNTVAVIPHVVTDYTISQDLMKAYFFYSLGLKVICPLALWPPHLSKDFAFLVTPGDSIERNLRDWVGESGPNSRWRIEFSQANSWLSRALAIQEKLAGGAQ